MLILPAMDSTTSTDDFSDVEILLDRGLNPKEAFRAGTIAISQAHTCHRPGMGLIFLVHEGRGEVLIDGHFVPCTPGQAYLCPPGILFALRPLGIWRVGWLAAARRVMPKLGSPRRATGPHDDLAAVMVSIASQRGLDQDPLLAETERNLASIALAKLVASVDNALGFMGMWGRVSANLSQSWSLQDIAHLAGMNPEQLRQECQKRFGISPMARVTALRMARARTLLVQGLPEAEVAAAVGYAGVTSFRAALRRKSPGV